MKVNLKQLGLVAAVAAVSAGVVGTANAQTRAAGNIGDLAIVPYYTTQDAWQTGLHVINTSDRTQVVKIRFRRALDSADAFDFNVVLSPEDEWTGSISDDTGAIRVSTTDTSCTVPSFSASGSLEMPNIFNVGAQEGYLEIIQMGAPLENETLPPSAVGGTPATNGSGIAWNAKHVRDAATGLDTPRNCAAVRSNFEIAGAPGTTAGWVSNAQTASTHVAESATDTKLIDDNTFENVDDAISVSYFIRDAATGIEFGGNAVHIAGFSTLPYMTNQVQGLLSGDRNGFDYPDLNGGPTGIERNRFNLLRSATVLGSSALINDWSVASARNVSTDWVVTFPGQYTMLDNYVWTFSGLDGSICGRAAVATVPPTTAVPLCDFRDIPVTATFTTLTNREEYVQAGAPPGSVVVSPQIPGAPQPATTLNNEVNVIEWTDGTTAPVLNSANTIGVNVAGLGEFGWAALTVTPNAAKTQLICAEYDNMENVVTPGQVTAGNPGEGANFTNAVFDFDGVRTNPLCTTAAVPIPMVGFVAWERAFPSNPGSNYGRMVDHSFR